MSLLAIESPPFFTDSIPRSLPKSYIDFNSSFLTSKTMLRGFGEVSSKSKTEKWIDNGESSLVTILEHESPSYNLFV